MKRLEEIFEKSLNVLRKKGFFSLIFAVFKYTIFRYWNIEFVSDFNRDYLLWIKQKELIDYGNNEIDFKYKPKISIIVPVYNVDFIWLDKCIKSVYFQTYENWELCIYDDASQKRETIECLKKWERIDSRIKIFYGSDNKHISAASNEAIKFATGEYVALLDNDDEISQNALYEVVSLINNYPQADFIYSDEDKIDEYGNRMNPFFKPNWSPDLLYSLNYICHLSIIKKTIGDQCGWFREGFEGAQDYDLFLRIVSKTKNIFHIPKILYHWRMLPTSTAKSIGSKKYAHDAGKRALTDYLNENNINAHVEDGFGSTNYRLIYKFPNEPVSIIIPFKDKVYLLKNCLESIIQKSSYKNYELILVSNNSIERETFEYLETLKEIQNIKIFERNIPFNYSALNNWAVQKSSGKYILFLNNDTEVLSNDWLEAMLMHASRDDIGAVGSLLYYPNKKIQHAGVILGMTGLAGHIFSGETEKNSYYNLPNYTRNYLAVTAACLLVSRDKYFEVSGLNESFTVCGNDVDFCLKLYEKGYLNVYTPYSKLIHYESVSRDKNPPLCDIEISQRRYSPYINNDPYFNENLSLDGTNIRINLKK